MNELHNRDSAKQRVGEDVARAVPRNRRIRRRRASVFPNARRTVVMRAVDQSA